MIAFLTSKNYTVAALKEIADRMGVKVPSGSKKGDVAALIVEGIESAHAYALDLLDKIEVVDRVIADKAQTLDAKTSNERRINNYMIFNGTDKLTAAQWRRVRKGLRKANLNLRDLTLCY